MLSHMKNIIKYSLFTATLLTSSSFALADTLVFKNGDSLSGDVKMNTLTSVVFETSFGATITVPRSKIERVETEHASQRIESNESTTKTDAATIAAIAPAAGGPFASAESQAKEKDVKWSGEVNLSGLLQTGNSEKNAIGADTEVTARRSDDRFIVKANYARAESEGTLDEDEASIEGIYDYFFKPEWFFNSNLKFETDKVSDSDLRSEFGLGLGHQPYESDALNLNYVIGTAYIREDFSGAGGTEEDIAATWSLDYDQKFFNDVLTLFHEHDLEMPVDDAGAFTLETETGIKVPVAEKLVGTAKVEFDWDNEPAPGIREEDTKYTFSLGYSW